MNLTIKSISDLDIEEIAGLVEWYVLNTKGDKDQIIDDVLTDTLALYEAEMPEMKIDVQQLRDILRIVTVAVRSL